MSSSVVLKTAPSQVNAPDFMQLEGNTEPCFSVSQVFLPFWPPCASTLARGYSCTTRSLPVLQTAMTVHFLLLRVYQAKSQAPAIAMDMRLLAHGSRLSEICHVEKESSVWILTPSRIPEFERQDVVRNCKDTAGLATGRDTRHSLL